MRSRSLLVLVALAASATACAAGEDDSGWTAPQDDAAADTATDTATDEAADSELPDTTLADSGSEDSAVLDTSVAESGAEAATDTGVVDTGVVDTGVVDTGAADTGVVDTGAVDTGAVDTGLVDTGVVDTGVVDTGVVDTGVVDTGVVDTGCPIDTVTSCGTCGRACSTTNVATRACASSLCTSSCSAGFVNCAFPSAPAADDGCECEGNACCGPSCQTKHPNGVGQFYFDCRALGTPGSPTTYTLAMAEAARAAWPPSGTDGAGTCGVGAKAALCVSRQTASSCAVWCYTNTVAGYMYANTTSTACYCPDPDVPASLMPWR
ncbi:MAG: hypothetical protein HYV09_28335 [Deltaproteobacteria bacterium]|nr:hypothetical protein [Deltaproteobacteria bacterium]